MAVSKKGHAIWILEDALVEEHSAPHFSPVPSSSPLQLPTSHLCPPTGFSKNLYKKKKLAWFKEKESGICGLPLPQLYLVSITSDHMARPASHTLSQGCNLVSPMGLCILLYHTVEIQLLLVFCKLPAKGFLFHFILASAACSLQKAFSENRFHKLQSPKTRNHCPFYLGTVF